MPREIWARRFATGRSACSPARYARRRRDDPFAARLDPLIRRTAVPSSRALRAALVRSLPRTAIRRLAVARGPRAGAPGEPARTSLGTASRSALRSAVRSIAAAAPLRRVPRRRFPHRECRPIRSPWTAERLFLHTPRSGLQEGACARGTYLWRALSAPAGDSRRPLLVGPSRFSGELLRSCWNRLLFLGAVLWRTARIAPKFSGEASNLIRASPEKRPMSGRIAYSGRAGRGAVGPRSPCRRSRGRSLFIGPRRPDRRRSARPGPRARRRSTRSARPRGLRRACRSAVSTPGCGRRGRSAR